MNLLKHIILPGLALLACLLPVLACQATYSAQKDLDDYRAEVRALQQRLERDPDDAQAHRDLGAIYVRTRNYQQGRRHLERARALAPDDAKAMLYLGLALEAQSDSAAALDVYQRYGEADEDRYRGLLIARSRALSRELARREVRSLLRDENTLDTSDLEPRTIGVFALAHQGTDARYEPLGRGLSELITVDLAKVEALTLVERLRLQVILDELEFGQREAVDPTSAPRLGRLLGAGTLVGGTYSVVGDRDVQLDISSWNLVTNQPPPVVTGADVLANLFALEKDIVFGLIGQFGLELSLEEQEAIRSVPTQNLEAFLAFSRGLIDEDRGAYRSALQHFQQAVTLDPGFQQAVDKATLTRSGLAGGDGGATEVFEEAGLLDGGTVGPERSLVDDRLRNLGVNIGSGFAPDPESRDPAQETAGATGESGLPAIGGLGRPPRPPNN
jgi:tetratricopeptide (TPR) repeat protein